MWDPKNGFPQQQCSNDKKPHKFQFPHYHQTSTRWRRCDATREQPVAGAPPGLGTWKQLKKLDLGRNEWSRQRNRRRNRWKNGGMIQRIRGEGEWQNTNSMLWMPK